MATAFLLPLTHLFASLRALAEWIVPRAARPTGAAARATAPRPAPCRPAKPLRVVRVLEPSAPRTVAGRMVISGRLADVCAELDRLAALEGR